MRRALLFPLGMLLALIVGGCSSAADEPSPQTPAERRCAPGENLQLCGKNLVIAHRGGAKLWPEETLLAYQKSAELGVDVLELDVHGTRDGEIVCMHDEDVDRTTDGTGKIKEKTLAEILALDAGAKFTTDGGATYPWRGKGLKVATLKEILAAFPGAHFSIEIKQTRPSIVDAVVAAIDAAGAADRVVVASFDDDTIAAVRAARPGLATSFAGGEIVKFTLLGEDDLEGYVPPAKLLQVPIGLATEQKVALARRLGLKMHIWTIDDRDDMERLWELGVDGIMTDDPVLLKDVTVGMGRADKGR